MLVITLAYTAYACELVDTNVTGFLLHFKLQIGLLLSAMSVLGSAKALDERDNIDFIQVPLKLL